MNSTINQMINRGSIRKFSTKHVENETLETILKATVQSPSYANTQAYSIIVVEDEKKRELLYNMTTGTSGKGMTFIQKAPIFLLFVMDFNKVNKVMKKENLDMHIHESMEALLVGAVDVGILLEATTVAAEALGLGTVAIGAIRRSAEDIIKEFKLPKYTFPVVGLCIGYPLDNIKPAPKLRLPLSTFAHKAHYQVSDLNTLLDKYNKEISESKFIRECLNRKLVKDAPVFDTAKSEIAKRKLSSSLPSRLREPSYNKSDHIPPTLTFKSTKIASVSSVFKKDADSKISKFNRLSTTRSLISICDFTT
jgi:FMN reductase [NAD(P)H]